MGNLSDSPTDETVDPPVRFVELDFELSAINPACVPQLRVLAKLHDHPFTWSLFHKSLALLTPFLAALMAAYAAGAYALTAPELQALWDLSTVYFSLGITVFVLGFGFAPIILAPISELYGRYWVFVGSGVVFFIGTMGCAITQSFGGMLVSRFIGGSGASVFASLTGGVVGDLFSKEHRNTPMSLYSLIIMAGTGIGPLISGVLVDRLSWRWVFYLQMILIGSTTLGLLLLFRETRANVLLARNCRQLNAHLQSLEDNGELVHVLFSGNLTTHVSKSDGCDGLGQLSASDWTKVRFQSPSPDVGSIMRIVGRSFRFPLMLLATESIVFWFSAWASFAWAILYMQFGSISLVYRNIYDFDSTQVGAVYTAVIVGSIIGCAMCIAQDHICHRYFPDLMLRPENRLYFACVGSFLLPVGLFWFGWTAKPEVPWIVPTLAIGTFEAGIFIIYLAVFNYLADTYGTFASSALAAQSMCRNVLAGLFPLFTGYMFNGLGYGRVGSLLGGIGVALCIVPWILVFYGETIRNRSPFTRQLHSA